MKWLMTFMLGFNLCMFICTLHYEHKFDKLQAGSVIALAIAMVIP